MPGSTLTSTTRTFGSFRFFSSHSPLTSGLLPCANDAVASATAPRPTASVVAIIDFSFTIILHQWAEHRAEYQLPNVAPGRQISRVHLLTAPAARQLTA